MKTTVRVYLEPASRLPPQAMMCEGKHFLGRRQALTRPAQQWPGGEVGSAYLVLTRFVESSKYPDCSSWYSDMINLLSVCSAMILLFSLSSCSIKESKRKKEIHVRHFTLEFMVEGKKDKISYLFF